MRIQGYINLKKYAYFITLNISQKILQTRPVCNFLKAPNSSIPTWYEKEKEKTRYEDQLVYSKFDTRSIKVMLIHL